MKQAISTPYKSCIFRETFNSEAECRRNGGTPTDVTFDKGKGIFNTNSKGVSYKNIVGNGTYSIRLILTPTLGANTQKYFNADYIEGFPPPVQQGFYKYISNEIITSSGTVYLNGETGTMLTGIKTEIIVTGITINFAHGFTIGYSNNVAVNDTIADIDLVEIYEGTLTASEVANLYNGNWQTELPPTTVLLDFDSTNGVLELGDYTNTATATDVIIKKTGSNYGALFNGTTSLIDTGTDMIGTKAVTCMYWQKQYSVGEGLSSNSGYLFFNGKSGIVNSTSNRIGFSSDGLSNAGYTANNSISLNQWQFVAVTREADGTVNFYIGDTKTAPTLNGSADQDSGTPEAGTTNVIIGNNASGTRTFDGLIKKLKVVEGILDIDEITRYWSNSLKHIK